MCGEERLRQSLLDKKQHSFNQAVFPEKVLLYYNRAIELEPEITRQVKGAAQAAGVKIAGMEYRIKSRDSFVEKIEREYSYEGSHYIVKDVLRYTYMIPVTEYVKKVSKIIEIYTDSGYNTIEVKNYWLDSQNPYNGVNTTVRSPSGQAFELQYHTPESFKVKNGKMHELYKKQRSIKNVNSKEYIELGDWMFELSDSMNVPKGIEKVKSHE